MGIASVQAHLLATILLVKSCFVIRTEPHPELGLLLLAAVNDVSEAFDVPPERGEVVIG